MPSTKSTSSVKLFASVAPQVLVILQNAEASTGVRIPEVSTRTTIAGLEVVATVDEDAMTPAQLLAAMRMLAEVLGAPLESLGLWTSSALPSGLGRSVHVKVQIQDGVTLRIRAIFDNAKYEDAQAEQREAVAA